MDDKTFKSYVVIEEHGKQNACFIFSNDVKKHGYVVASAFDCPNGNLIYQVTFADDFCKSYDIII